MVYQNFLEHHIDYIYFLYGSVFFMLGLYGLLAARAGGTRLPWVWLGLFALLHGANEHLDMTVRAVESLATVRYFLLASSYLCLLEFGRAGTAGPDGPKKGRLVFPVLLGLSLAGLVYGAEGLEPAARYALGLPAGIWASAAFIKSARDGGAGSGRLWYAGAAMGLYALATGLVVPGLPFMPASIINCETFLKAAGFSVQMLRLVLVLVITVSLIGFFRTVECAGKAQPPWRRPHCSYISLGMILVILAIGWPATELVGRHVEGEARENLLSRVLTAAAIVQPEMVAALTGTPADEGRPAFEHLRADLQRIKAANPDLRYVYLMGLRDDHEYFLVDAEPKGSKDYSAPGDLYPDATPEDIADFRKGKAKVYPPYRDSWGFWVSGVAFIKDPETGGPAAMLGMDIDAERWLHQVALSRFFCMAITFACTVLSVALYFSWQRRRDMAEQGLALILAEQRVVDEKKLRDLVDSLGEGVIVQDAEGRVVLVNPEAERLLARGADAMAGRPLTEALGLTDGGGVPCSPPRRASVPALDSGGTFREEDGWFIRGDGAVLPVSYVLSPITESGRVTGAVMAFQDITIRKDIERQKKDFFAMVTHDLKSPLLVIQGYTDVMLDEKASVLDEESMDMLERVREGGRKMLRMVNDFLTVSRFESGSLTLNEALDDIGAAVGEALAEITPLAHKKGIAVEAGADAGLRRLIFDKAHVQRAVSNLLHNAVHYTPNGGMVAVSVEDVARDGAEYAAVSVSDNGPGIPPEEREKVFCMYYRSASTAGLKGSGLGLAIVKAVAVAHGGTVELDSEEGRGSTFRLLIPRNMRS